VLFEQVLFNLLDNAAKYSPVGAGIEVRAARDGATVVLQIMFYASGVFFTVDAIAGQKHGQLLVDIFFCNPFAALLAPPYRQLALRLAPRSHPKAAARAPDPHLAP